MTPSRLQRVTWWLLVAATVLTLVFLPALYVAVNGISEKAEPKALPTAEPEAPAYPVLLAQQ